MLPERAVHGGSGGGASAAPADLRARAAELLLLRAAGGSLQDGLDALRVQGVGLLDALPIVRGARDLGMGISLEDGRWLCAELRPSRPSAAARLDLLHRLMGRPLATVQLAHHLARNRDTGGLVDQLRALGIEPLSLAFCCEHRAEGAALLADLDCPLPEGLPLPDWGRSALDRTPGFVGLRIPPLHGALVSPGGFAFDHCDLPAEMPPLHAPRLWFRGGRGLRRLTSVQAESLSIQDQPSLERLPRPLAVEELVLKDCPRLKLDGPLRVARHLELRNLPVLERWPEDLGVGQSLRLHHLPRLALPAALALPPTAHLAHLPGLARIQEPLMVRGEVVLEGCPWVELPRRITGGGTLILRMLPRLAALPEGCSVEGNLVIDQGPLRTLPKGLRVSGDLTLLHLDELTGLPGDLAVGGRLRIVACRSLAGPAWPEALPFPAGPERADA